MPPILTPSARPRRPWRGSRAWPAPTWLPLPGGNPSREDRPRRAWHTLYLCKIFMPFMLFMVEKPNQSLPMPSSVLLS